MRKQKIEDYFRSRLSEDEVFIDKNELWDSLGLEKEEEERKAKWFWLSGLMGLLVILALGYNFIENQAGSDLSANTEKYLSENTGKQKTKAISSTTSPNTSQSSLIKSKLENNKKVNTSKTSGLAEQNTIATTDSESAHKEIIASSNITLKKRETIAQERKAKSFGLKNTKINQSQKTIIASVSSPSRTAVQKSKASLDITNQFSRHPIVSSSMDRNALIRLSQLPTITGQFLKVSLKGERKIVSPLSFESKELENVTTPSRSWAAGAYMGLYFTQRRMEAQPETELYVSNRNQYESSLETSTAGVFVQGDINDNFYFKLGVEMQTITERFEYAITFDTTFLNSASMKSTVLWEWRNYNRHKLYNVPFSLGYQKALGSWNFITELSAIVTLKQSFDGLLYEPNETLNNQASHFRTGASFAMRYAVGLSYNYRNWNFYFLPNYQHHQGSFSKKELGYTQKYKMIGAQLGLQCGF